jgi:hypothetical protein
MLLSLHSLRDLESIHKQQEMGMLKTRDWIKLTNEAG